MEKRINSGFTLVELVVVMVIVGILAALSILSYRRYILRSRIQEGVLVAGAVAQAQKYYFDDKGMFKTVSAGTDNDADLGVDIRGNTLFTSYGVSVDGSGSSSVFTVTVPGSGPASGMTVIAEGGATIPTAVTEHIAP